MPAYWVARSKVNAPVEYKRYTDLVPGIIAKYGGKVLARGGGFSILEGTDKFHRFTLNQFSPFEVAGGGRVGNDYGRGRYGIFAAVLGPSRRARNPLKMRKTL